MARKTKAARHRCNDNRAKTRISQDTVTDQIITQDFERGSMIAAIVMAPFFGACMLMWAVVPC